MGQGTKRRRRRRMGRDVFFDGPTTNIQLLHLAKNIPFFRGVYMLDKLPIKPHVNETLITNLSKSTDSNGTHWICHAKFGPIV